MSPARRLGSLFILAGALAGCGAQVEVSPEAQFTSSTPRVEAVPSPPTPQGETDVSPSPKRPPMTEAEWRAILAPEQYHVLREKGTERAFTGEYWDTKTVGTYVCAGCGTPLFKSDAKFDSGCGWPSFFEPLDGAKLTQTEDRTHGMVRTEVCCKTCGGHMGHVFNDGPKPTGLRFCINSASIRLQPKDKPTKDDSDAKAGKAETPPAR